MNQTYMHDEIDNDQLHCEQNKGRLLPGGESVDGHFKRPGTPSTLELVRPRCGTPYGFGEGISNSGVECEEPHKPAQFISQHERTSDRLQIVDVSSIERKKRS